MDDLSNIYEEARKYLRTALAGYGRMLPDLYEDAFQEGMIQVWRDVEAGEPVKLKILRRASLSASKFFQRNGEYYFGKPKKSREGIRQNSSTLEKMQVYLDEVLPVNGNVYPTPAQAAQDLGISQGSAGKAIKAIREGRVDHMVYRSDGRKDWDHYSTMSIQKLDSSSEEGGTRSWTDNPKLAGHATSFENEIVESMDLDLLLSKLAEGPREVLSLYLYDGYDSGDLGRHRGYTTNVSQKGNRLLVAAISQAGMLLNPYEGECSSGHERSEESTLVKQRKADGIYTRVCLVCKSAAAKSTLEKRKKNGTYNTGRPVKTHCPQGHLKEATDSRGSLRCRECRRVAQLRYTQRKRDEGTS